MMRFGMEKHDEYMDLLKKYSSFLKSTIRKTEFLLIFHIYLFSIPIFQGLREEVLSKFIDVIDEVKNIPIFKIDF